MSSTSVFISHSSHDEDLANQLIHTIESSFDVPLDSILCTSVGGYKLLPGAVITLALQEAITDATVVIGLITPNSIASAWPLYELGAAWALAKEPIALLAGDIKFNDFKGPLASTNALRLDNEGNLNDLLDQIEKRMEWKRKAGAQRARAIKELISKSSLPLQAIATASFTGNRVRASGFEFFPDRETMNRFRDLGEILRNATTIKMILVGGAALIEGKIDMRNVCEVILPHPRSASLSLYATTVDDAHALPGKILATTAKLLQKGIDVKWYPHMINHAVIIADPEKESGWVQWESVLPYAPLNLRPCVIVEKVKFERLVSSIHKSFNQMFNASEPPPSELRESRAQAPIAG